MCRKKRHTETSGISTPPEKAEGTHFHTTPVFLPADKEVSWPLLPSSVSLLSGGTVQPENAYSYIFMTDQA